MTILIPTIHNTHVHVHRNFRKEKLQENPTLPPTHWHVGLSEHSVPNNCNDNRAHDDKAWDFGAQHFQTMYDSPVYPHSQSLVWYHPNVSLRYPRRSPVCPHAQSHSIYSIRFLLVKSPDFPPVQVASGGKHGADLAHRLDMGPRDRHRQLTSDINSTHIQYHVCTYSSISTMNIYIYIYSYYIYTYIWVNYNDLTATSLETWLIREIIPKWP